MKAAGAGSVRVSKGVRIRAGMVSVGDPDKHYVPPQRSAPITADADRAQRQIEEIWETRPTLEGAGVRLERAFGNPQVPRLDPFLLLDDFRSEEPQDYLAGFPWHPHRGIQTVTYMLDGYVDHGDSLGNAGRIGPGDVQWMSAGSGIIHQEMPKGEKDVMGGLQLWVNVPAADKMARPGYQEYKSENIPTLHGDGHAVRLVSGRYRGMEGPVRDIAVRPQFLDITMEPGRAFEHDIPGGHRAFAYVLDGAARFEEGHDRIEDHHVVLFRDGDHVRVETTGDPVRFLLVSGRPLKEPVAWWGPIVMNTQRELDEAVADLQKGTFVKTGAESTGDAASMRRPSSATGAT